MWTREELKTRGKRSFRKFYLGAVVVCLITLIFTTEFGINDGEYTKADEAAEDAGQIKDLKQYVIQNPLVQSIEKMTDSALRPMEKLGGVGNALSKLIKVPIFLAMYTVPVVIGILFLGFGVLIGNPLRVGAKRYFMKNRRETAGISTILCGFKKGYGNITWTMLCMEVFSMLWTLLFVIPGIIKSYEYRMIPYILSENPDIGRKRVFELSKQMMDGQKWNAFILDISFILWNLLGAITFNIANIFYVHPYMAATDAELYAVLRNGVLEEQSGLEQELIGF